MLVVLIISVIAAIALCVMLLQRRQPRKPVRERYFSHTLGISEPRTPAAKDDTPAT